MVGINYYLDRLPNGYQLMEYPKSSDDSHVCSKIYDTLFLKSTLTDVSDTNVCWVTLAADSMTRNPDFSFTSCG